MSNDRETAARRSLTFGSTKLRRRNGPIAGALEAIIPSANKKLSEVARWASLVRALARAAKASMIDLTGRWSERVVPHPSVSSVSLLRLRTKRSVREAGAKERSRNGS